MKKPWSCEDTAAHMEAYTLDVLAADVADRLVEHALRCPHCYAVHWAPFVEDASRLDAGFLDELMSDGGETDKGLEPPPTFDGTGLETQRTAFGEGVGGTGVSAGPSTEPRDDHLEDSARFRLEPGTGSWLREVGTVLPPVPKPELIRAYCWYLGDGPPRPGIQGRAPARIRVEGDRTSSHVCVESLKKGSDSATLDGSPLLPDQRIVLQWTHLLECGSWRYLVEITSGDISWKGTGVLRHTGPSWPLGEGRLLVGRDRIRCTIVLRDFPGNANLEWHPGALDRLEPKQRAHIRQLTLDSVEVSRVHAELVKEGKMFELRGCTRYPVYRIRGGEVQSTCVDMAGLSIVPGDLLRIGHQLFEYREI